MSKTNEKDLEKVSGGSGNQNYSAKVSLSYSNEVLTVTSSEPMKHIYVKAGIAFLTKTSSVDVNGALTAKVNIFCMQGGFITATISFMDGTEAQYQKQV